MISKKSLFTIILCVALLLAGGITAAILSTQNKSSDVASTELSSNDSNLSQKPEYVRYSVEATVGGEVSASSLCVSSTGLRFTATLKVNEEVLTLFGNSKTSTVSAIANEGYAFDYWDLDGEVLSGSISKLVSSFVTQKQYKGLITAHFKSLQTTSYSITFAVSQNNNDAGYWFGHSNTISSKNVLVETTLNGNPSVMWAGNNGFRSFRVAEGYEFVNFEITGCDLNGSPTGDVVVTAICASIEDTATEANTDTTSSEADVLKSVGYFYNPIVVISSAIASALGW